MTPGAARRWVSAHRRLLAALAAAAAVASALGTFRAPPAATAPVVVAAAYLPAGTMLAASGLRVERLPVAEVPQGAVTSIPVGRVLAQPLPAGEPLTGSALAGTATLPPGTVQAAVPLSVPAESGTLAVDDLVSIIGVRGDGPAAVVASGRVAALPSSGLVVLTVSSAEALALAAAAASDRLSAAVDAFG